MLAQRHHLSRVNDGPALLFDSRSHLVYAIFQLHGQFVVWSYKKQCAVTFAGPIQRLSTSHQLLQLVAPFRLHQTNSLIHFIIFYYQISLTLDIFVVATCNLFNHASCRMSRAYLSCFFTSWCYNSIMYCIHSS